MARGKNYSTVFPLIPRNRLFDSVTASPAWIFVRTLTLRRRWTKFWKNAHRFLDRSNFHSTVAVVRSIVRKISMYSLENWHESNRRHFWITDFNLYFTRKMIQIKPETFESPISICILYEKLSKLNRRLLNRRIQFVHYAKNDSN